VHRGESRRSRTSMFGISTYFNTSVSAFRFGGTRPVHPDDGGGMLAERSIFLKLYGVTSEETLIVTFGIPFSRPSISPRRRTPFPGMAAGYREKPREEQLVSALEQQPAPMTSDPK